MEEIIRGAVLLKDDDDILDLRWELGEGSGCDQQRDKTKKVSRADDSWNYREIWREILAYGAGLCAPLVSLP